MNNIFKDAKFGDKFLCKNGKIALFDKFYETSNEYHLYIEDGYSGFYSKHGDYIDEDYPDENYDIVSRYQEPIDEEKLNDLAIDSAYHMSRFERTNDWTRDDYYREGFKAGYRKQRRNNYG